MKERDTRGDMMIIQDCKNVAFGEVIEYKENEAQFNMNMRVTKGKLLTGEHKVDILRPYNVLTEGIPVSLQ